MKDYILEQIKYRELSGENKKDILLDLYLHNLITEIDYMDYLNINKDEFVVLINKDNISFNLGITTYKTLVDDFSEEIANQIINLFYSLIDSGGYPWDDNYRIKEVGNDIYEQLYDKVLKQGCSGFYDEEYEINNRKFKLGFNYGH